MSLSRLKKEPFSLVLGWGGARWFAHIGVLRFLEEHKLKPTEIVGTSMGACIGAYAAFGLTSHQIEDIVKDISYTSLFDFDLKTGLVQGDKIRHFLKKTFNESVIEDLTIPLRICATTLNGGKTTIFNSWSVIDALRASISLPWLFSPYSINGSEYVDGCLTANLPIEHATYQTCIAVSVVKDVNQPITFTDSRFGLKVARNRFALNKDVLSRALNIMLTEQEDEMIKNTDKQVYFIRPCIQDIGVLSIEKIDEAIALGYNQARVLLMRK